MYKWGSRVLCILVFLMQCVTLDYYLVNYLTPVWAAWIIVDLICLAMFVCTLVIASDRAFKHRLLSKCRRSIIIGHGELPLAYIAWALYALQASIRTAILFRYVASQLEEKNVFGPNTMRTAMALTAVLFLQLVLAHHDSPRKKCIHDYINDVAGSTALDILDAVAILDVLYDPKSRDNLDPQMHTTIVTLSSINIMLPTIPLFVLSRGHFDEKRSNVAMYMSYRLLDILFGDFALLTMRMLLWHVKDEYVSVFVIKNIISIGMTLKQVYELFVPEKGTANNSEQGDDVSDGKGGESGDGVDKKRGMRDDTDEIDLGLSSGKYNGKASEEFIELTSGGGGEKTDVITVTETDDNIDDRVSTDGSIKSRGDSGKKVAKSSSGNYSNSNASQRRGSKFRLSTLGFDAVHA